jgi:hypothetical protein
MQNAETVLGVLRERGRKGLPCDEVYRQMFNVDLYLMAYGRIYANQGAMTPGPDAETADGMSMDKIQRIIEAMRHERYRFRPVRRTFIPKKNGKLRPLGLPSWSDNLSVKWCVCCSRHTTSRRSPTTRMDSGPAEVATLRSARWNVPGPGPCGSSRVTSLTVSAVWITM